MRRRTARGGARDRRADHRARFSSLAVFAPTLRAGVPRVLHNFTWFTFGEQTLRLGFVLDPLAAVMLVMITLVSLCIFVFSVGYMATTKISSASLLISHFSRRDARAGHREQPAFAVSSAGNWSGSPRIC